MVNGKEIRVLVVEGSAVARPILIEILKSDPRIRICAVVEYGLGAIVALAGQTPDVVLMDVDLPGMDGYETTRRIMETKPVPIVVCAEGGSGAVEIFKMTENILQMKKKPLYDVVPKNEIDILNYLEVDISDLGKKC